MKRLGPSCAKNGEALGENGIPACKNFGQSDKLFHLFHDDVVLFWDKRVEVINSSPCVSKMKLITKFDGVLKGPGWSAVLGCESFTHNASLFADDGAFLFSNKEALIEAPGAIYEVFKRFDATMRLGKEGKSRKLKRCVSHPKATMRRKRCWGVSVLVSER